MNRIGMVGLGLLILFLLLGGLLAVHEPVTAVNSITVNTATDNVANDGMCSLREAVIAANSDSAFNGCVGGAGTDTIEFASSLPSPSTFTLTLTGKNEDSAMSGDLDITEDVIILGAGKNITTIDGNGTDRIFEVHSGVHLTIGSVTVQNGNPGAGINGGGLLVRGWLTMNESVVTANQGSGIHNDGGFVELINAASTYNHDYGVRNENLATLTFDGGTISHNNGGGLYNAASTATLSYLTISQNSSGSGVYSIGSTSLTRINIDHSSILTNTTSANGGGIYNSGNFANAAITTSLISGNQANGAGGGAGGGVFNNGIMTLNESTLAYNVARTGGGIEHSGANLYLTNDTISFNQAADDGGGLHNNNSAILKNVTLYANSASTGGNIFNDEAQMAIGNSVVASGTCFNSNGFLNSQGHNIDSGSSCQFNAAGDLVNTDPKLQPLGDNGGPTPTHALNSDSPAVDQGDDGACPATDQRGVSRPQGSHCDMGAFEAGGTADLAISVSTSPAPIFVGDVFTYTIVVQNIGVETAASLIMTNTLPVEAAYVDSQAGNGGVCSGSSVVVCTLPSLANGAEWIISIGVQAPALPAALTNEATVIFAGEEGNKANNTAVSVTNIILPKKIYLPFVIQE